MENVLIFARILVWLLISRLLLSNDVVAQPPEVSRQPDSRCILTIGLSEWLPYQSISDSGRPSGFQIELLKKIASHARCQLKFQSTKFSEGITAIADGKIDVMMNATPSEARKEFAYFSIPYRNEFLLLYSTQAWLSECQKLSLKELVQQGFRLGVQKDVVFGKTMRALQADPVLNSKLIYIDNDSPHLALVERLGLDGIIDDPVVVAYLSTTNSTGNSLSSCPIKVSSSPVSFMFSKKTVPIGIVARFNQAIRIVQSTKQYKKRWSW